MTTYYEAHVTFLGTPAQRADAGALVESLGWRFSAIDGDPNLGEGVKFYATRQFNSRWGYDKVLVRLIGTALAIEAGGYRIARRKIESVLFDDRSEKVQCLGACQECIGED